MRYFGTSALFVATVAACAPPANVGTGPSAPTPASGAVDANALGLVLPRTVRTYRLTEAIEVEGDRGDRGFRYSSGSRTRISVFVYPADSAAAVAEPRQVIAQEGPLFMQTLAVGVQRGWYDDYNVAFAYADSLDVDGRWVRGYVTAAPTKRAGRINVEFQYLYLIGTRFLKVRASVPAEGWENTDVPLFAQELATALERQRPP